MSMEVVYTRCCGLDVHKQSVVACTIVPGAARRPTKTIRTFGTTTDQLEALAEWLLAQKVTHAVMESTGVFWKPVFNILAGRIEVVVVNAQHVKVVPGRKTDVADSEWLADLLRHGLLRASFIPDQAQRQLRDLTRTRVALIDERSRTIRRLHKVLEDANIKLSSVATDVLGVSGRAMIEALVAGTTDPRAMADLARGKLRAKLPALEQALTGRVSEHHRLLLKTHLAHIDFLDQAITQLSEQVSECLRPFEAELERLQTIPGIKRRTAEVLAAETGLDMGRFPSAAHLASWAGMCPGNQESAGKRKTGKTRKGSKWLRRALVEAGRAAARKRGSSFFAQYRRLAARRGPNKAAVAVGHALLTTVYYVLARQDTYRGPDPVQQEQHLRARTEKRALRQLQDLGYTVTLTPLSQAA
jgi:transposase